MKSDVSCVTGAEESEIVASPLSFVGVVVNTGALVGSAVGFAVPVGGTIKGETCSVLSWIVGNVSCCWTVDFVIEPMDSTANDDIVVVVNES